MKVDNSERGENWDLRGLRMGLLIPPSHFPALKTQSLLSQRLVVVFRCHESSWVELECARRPTQNEGPHTSVGF